jgi:hypothetical protein
LFNFSNEYNNLDGKSIRGKRGKSRKDAQAQRPEQIYQRISKESVKAIDSFDLCRGIRWVKAGNPCQMENLTNPYRIAN